MLASAIRIILIFMVIVPSARCTGSHFVFGKRVKFLDEDGEAGSESGLMIRKRRVAPGKNGEH